MQEKLKSNRIKVTHATIGDKEEQLTVEGFFSTFEPFFNNNSMMIDRAWNPNIINGLVRCYLSGSKVAGSGYREINDCTLLSTEFLKNQASVFITAEIAACSGA